MVSGWSGAGLVWNWSGAGKELGYMGGGLVVVTRPATAKPLTTVLSVNS